MGMCHSANLVSTDYIFQFRCVSIKQFRILKSSEAHLFQSTLQSTHCTHIYGGLLCFRSTLLIHTTHCGMIFCTYISESSDRVDTGPSSFALDEFDYNEIH